MRAFNDTFVHLIAPSAFVGHLFLDSLHHVKKGSMIWFVLLHERQSPQSFVVDTFTPSYLSCQVTF